MKRQLSAGIAGRPLSVVTTTMHATECTIGTDTIRQIVSLATRAPSAENTQPWRFCWCDGALDVMHDRSRQMPSDLDAMLDLTGVGACVESAVAAAARFGLAASVEMMHDPIDEAPGHVSYRRVARLRFSGGVSADPHADLLESRRTTRRMDARRPLSDQQRDALAGAADGFDGARIDWVPEASVATVARLIGLGNRIRFEHEAFHAEFFDNLRFTPDQARRSRDGLDIATLQLPPGVASVMRAVSWWPLARVANVIGFSRGVARQAAEEVQSSGAVGVLTVPDATPHAFVTGGRALVRVWLEATRMGLAFHPSASLPVFLGHAERGNGRTLQPKHQQMAERMVAQFRKTMPSLKGRMLQMAFRVGNGEAPRESTLRRDCDSILEVK